MTVFTTALPETTSFDEAKRVRYTFGMLLGVDDFQQESAYHRARGADVVRELIGHGVVRGLAVTSAVDDGVTRVVVAPGLAAVPSGRLVRVEAAQCADLGAWVNAHDAGVREALAGTPPPSKPGRITLAVTLAYDTCDTDPMPIPGEPCRDAEALLEASRVRDDFRLDLEPAWSDETRADLPSRAEQVATERFVRWLRAVPVVAGAADDLAGFLAVIREASGVQGRAGDEVPPEQAFPAGQPPFDLVIAAEHADAWLAAAFSLWTRELLPLWRRCTGAAAPQTQHASDRPDAIRLALVDVRTGYDPVTSRWLVAGAQPHLPDGADQCGLHLLQQWLLTQPPPAARPGGIVAAGVLQRQEAAAGTRYVGAGMSATPSERWVGLLELTFPGSDGPGPFVITATPLTAAGSVAHVLDLVGVEDRALPLLRVTVGGETADDMLGLHVVVTEVTS